MLIGGASSNRSKPAWKQVYRALEHGFCKNVCGNIEKLSFPDEIQDFAARFVTMQEKRHKADYDPNEKALKSAVLTDIDMTEAVIQAFRTAPLKDRRAFAAIVLFKRR